MTGGGQRRKQASDRIQARGQPCGRAIKTAKSRLGTRPAPCMARPCMTQPRPAAHNCRCKSLVDWWHRSDFQVDQARKGLRGCISYPRAQPRILKLLPPAPLYTATPRHCNPYLALIREDDRCTRVGDGGCELAEHDRLSRDRHVLQINKQSKEHGNMSGGGGLPTAGNVYGEENSSKRGLYGGAVGQACQRGAGQTGIHSAGGQGQVNVIGRKSAWD